MNKLEVQKRVTLAGKPLPLEDFSWCEKTRTFKSDTSNLDIGFRNERNVIFFVRAGCKISAGANCTVTSVGRMTVTTGCIATWQKVEPWV